MVISNDTRVERESAIMPNKSTKSISRVSLRDIAREANVSIGSVSSVLNNRHLERRIPQETAQKIRETTARLGYLPNINARRLRGGSGAKNTVLLALITSFEAPIPLINHFVMALHREAEREEFARHDYSFALMIEMFSAGRLRELPGLLTGDRFNAAVILNTVDKDDRFLSRTHLPYPAVLVNRSIAGYPSVIEDPECGSRAAELLARSKKKCPAVLHGNPLTQTTEHRVHSFMRRCREIFGQEPDEIMAESLTETGGYEAMKNYYKRGSECGGLYTVSDALALGAYRAIKESNRSIPKDVAVVGVGDYEIAPFFDPSLSCIGVSHQELASKASRMLMSQIHGEMVRGVTTIPLEESLRASLG